MRAFGGTELMTVHPLPQRLVRHFLVVGPLEEFSKRACVLVLAYWTRFIRDPLDGMICGASVAIGFSCTETAEYMFHEGWFELPPRALIVTPVHMVCSALWGYGLGLARVTRNQKRAWLGMGLSLAAGAFFHGLYSGSIEFQRWQDASELTLYAGLATPVVLYLFARLFRHHLKLARLWSAWYRRSLALKRRIAMTLDQALVRQAWDLRPETPRATQYWSATVNVVAQNVLGRLARALPPEAAERVAGMLTKPDSRSRQVYDLQREVGGVEEIIATECGQMEQCLAPDQSGTWRERRRTTKLRKRIRWQVRTEGMTLGPVHRYQRS